jgi:thioesterase domain-containing protein
MPEDLAVFGIEPRRLGRVPVAHTRIEDLAAFYVDEVRKQQTHGPYLLAGMCAGGVIAYEMASQLVRAGERVDLVGLLDAATPRAPKRPGRVTKQRVGRLKEALALGSKSELAPLKRARVVAWAIAQKLMSALLWEIAQRGKRWTVRIRFRLLQELLARELAWPRFVSELSVRQILDSAEARYVPGPLSIPCVVLVRARTGEDSDTPYRDIYRDETLGWDNVADKLTVVDVDGGHSSMLQEPFVSSLANALMPYVKQKQAKPIRRGPLATEII